MVTLFFVFETQEVTSLVNMIGTKMSIGTYKL